MKANTFQFSGLSAEGATSVAPLAIAGLNDTDCPAAWGWNPAAKSGSPKSHALRSAEQRDITGEKF